MFFVVRGFFEDIFWDGSEQIKGVQSLTAEDLNKKSLKTPPPSAPKTLAKAGGVIRVVEIQRRKRFIDGELMMPSSQQAMPPW